MNIKGLLRQLIKEAVNRSFGSTVDLANYRDINLDSPSSLSKARGSQGLKVSNVGDSSKNIPFNDKMNKLYNMVLPYMIKKLALRGSELKKRGDELKEFIKNFLTRDEIEKFYYRLSRFSSGTKEFKRICEQFIDYMQTGQMSNIDVYDKIDMGDEDNKDAYSVSSYAMFEDQLSKMKNRMKPIREKIAIIKNILNNNSKYKPLDRKDIDFAISNGFIDSDEFKVKVSASKTGGMNREKDVFLVMLNKTLQDYNNELKYLEGVIIDMYNEYQNNKYM
jgi:hypothetical protein